MHCLLCRFIDSLQFLNAALDKLAGNLKPEDFVQTKLHGMHNGKGNVDLLMRKGVFCYDYFDSPEKAEETKLPPRTAFYSRLTGERLSISEYWHANRVWREFEIANLGQYHDLYLKVSGKSNNLKNNTFVSKHEYYNC